MSNSLCVMAFLYVLAGLIHFVRPRFYVPMMPPAFKNPIFWILLSGAAEVILGLSVCVPHLRNAAAFLIVMMLIVFLWPHAHMWKTRKTNFPKIPPWVLVARFPMQLVLILWALSQVNWGVMTGLSPLSVVYKIAENGEQVSGQIFRPRADRKVPAVVVVHGGSWQHTAGDMVNLSQQIAAAGFVAFNVDYRLAPQNKYPKAVEDVKDAILWLQQHADEYGVEKNHISGWGYSAGAHLILLAGLDPALKLDGLVAGGTPADLTAWPDSPIVKTFLGASYEEDPKLWLEASPISHVDAGSPPVFLYHGEWDSFVELYQLMRMRDALLEKNRPFEIYSAPHLGHIGTYFFSQDSIDRGLAFLKKQKH